MKQQLEYRRIGDISNYYGGLYAAEHNGKYYWLIENYSTDFDEMNEEWEEIDKELYNSLIAYETRRLSE